MQTTRTDNTASDPKSHDRALVLRASAGDSDAFSELVQRHYSRALGVAMGMLGNREDAEDAVQEAFARAHARLADFRAAAGFYTWLYRIVVNLSIDQMRRRRRERRVDVEDEQVRDAMSHGESLWPGLDRSDPFASASRAQMRNTIGAAIGTLPEIHRAVIVLREVEGLSYGEISDALGIKKGTVMSRLFHARKTMQRHLGGAPGSWMTLPATPALHAA